MFTRSLASAELAMLAMGCWAMKVPRCLRRKASKSPFNAQTLHPKLTLTIKHGVVRY